MQKAAIGGVEMTMAKKAKKPKKASKPTRPAMNSCHGYGIVGPYNTMWTTQVFAKPEQAWKYLEEFWRGVPNHDKSKYRLVWARQASYFLRESRHSADLQ